MKLYSSLKHLDKLGLNVGEALLESTQHEVPSTVIEALERGGYKGVIRTDSRRENFVALTPGECRAFFVEGATPAILFKHPKNNERLMHGYCTPLEHSNVYEFYDMNGTFRVYWGTKVDTRGYLTNAEAHCKVVDKINSILVQKKSELIGVEIEWSIFEKGCGSRGEQVVFWGYRGGEVGNP